MSVRRRILPILTLFFGLGLFYWASWEFGYKRRPMHADRFAPSSITDRCLNLVFRPAESMDMAVSTWWTRQAAHNAIHGSWSCLIWHENDVVDLIVEIQDDTLTFTDAKEWPELHKRKFTILESDIDPDEFYIVRESRRLNVKPEQETTKAGVVPKLHL